MLLQFARALFGGPPSSGHNIPRWCPCDCHRVIAAVLFICNFELFRLYWEQHILTNAQLLSLRHAINHRGMLIYSSSSLTSESRLSVAFSNGAIERPIFQQQLYISKAEVIVSYLQMLRNTYVRQKSKCLRDLPSQFNRLLSNNVLRVKHEKNAL